MYFTYIIGYNNTRLNLKIEQKINKIKEMMYIKKKKKTAGALQYSAKKFK